MTRNSQQRITADPMAAYFGRSGVCVWTAPTLDQIAAACPGLAQEIDGERLYLVPHNGRQLPITFGALERLYAYAANG
jgi:hypothetical protein